MWAVVGEALGKIGWAPSSEDELGAWMCAKKGNGYLGNKDIHTMLLLVLWELWKHRNAIVFDGAAPSVERLIDKIKAESALCVMAGLFKGRLDEFLSGLHRWRIGEG